jgi:hypothetical protein
MVTAIRNAAITPEANTPAAARAELRHRAWHSSEERDPERSVLELLLELHERHRPSV